MADDEIDKTLVAMRQGLTTRGYWIIREYQCGDDPAFNVEIEIWKNRQDEKVMLLANTHCGRLRHIEEYSIKEIAHVSAGCANEKSQ